MQISFGQKIPIAKTQIKSLEENNFISATVFELDCRDKSDLDEVNFNNDDWHYDTDIRENMRDKNSIFNRRNIEIPNYFYILQTQENETLAIAQIDINKRNTASLEWLDTKTNKPYKFVGQTFLATLTKEIFKKGGHNIVIPYAIREAMPFYINKCGFENLGKNRLYMNESQMKKFINATEEKTGPILDLSI